MNHNGSSVMSSNHRLLIGFDLCETLELKTSRIRPFHKRNHSEQPPGEEGGGVLVVVGVRGQHTE